MKRTTIVIFVSIIFIIAQTIFAESIKKTGIYEITDKSAELFFNFKQDICVVLSENGKIEQPEIGIKIFNRTKVDLNKIQPFKENNYVLYNGKGNNLHLFIVGMGFSKDYVLSIFSKSKIEVKENYELLKSYKFSTLHYEPTQQAKNIIFTKIKTGEITLLWSNGNGRERLILARKSREPELPKDGKVYSPNSNFGSAKSIVGDNTFAIYQGHGRNVTVKNLASDTYYFQIYELNGEGRFINYLTKPAQQNPRSKEMPLPPPKVKEATELSENSFIANWVKVDGAVYYLLDVARDKDFNSKLEMYDELDIGKIDNMIVMDIEPGKYFYRLRTVGRRNKSSYSNVIKVVIESNKEH